MEHINLIQARKEKGYTQKEIAEILAMEQTTYSKKERGISRIRESEWIRFADILQKDVDELKSKNKNQPDYKNLDSDIYLRIIKVIIKYNKELEKENFLLKKIIKKDKLNP